MVSLAFTRSIAAGATINACVSRGTAGEIVVIENNTSLKRFNTSTGSQVGSTVTIASGGALCMLTANLAAVMSTSSTTVQIVDITTGTITTVASMATCASQRYQFMAGDPANGVAFGICNSTSNAFVKFTSSPGASFVNPDWLENGSSRFPFCITYKEANRFLVGLTHGVIAEMDQNGNLIKEMFIPGPRILFNPPDSNVIPIQIQNLHYDSRGFLLASTASGCVYLINWNTGTILQCLRLMGWASGTASPYISTEGGLTALVSPRDTVNFACKLPVAAWDMYQTPFGQSTPVDLASGSLITSLGIDDSGLGWVALSSTIYIYTISSIRSTADKAVTTSGNNTELIVMDDTASPAKVMLHCDIASGGQSVPVTTGIAATKLLMASTWFDGTRQQFKVNRNTGTT